MHKPNNLKVTFLLCLLPAVACASVTVHEDSTVSFCYCGVGKRVYVQTDLQYTDRDSNRYTDHPKRIRMHRGADGCFHYTTPKAVHPETYTYCFRVNGKRRPDALNRDTAWQKMHKWNVLTVEGSAQAGLYKQPSQQGTFHRVCWNSKAEGTCRRTNVYVPAEQCTKDKGQCTKKGLPVLYLIHGINGYEGSWSERGRAIQIMENLVAEGKCEPMIIVMPDVNFGVHEDRPSHHTLWNNVFNYPRLCHDRDLEKALVELVAFVDSTYHVSSDPKDHLIAGFSDGARLAANTANLLPGYFAAVGLFSPVVHKDQLPQDSATYYIYTGKGDLFHLNAKRFHRRMEKKQTAHRYTETEGGHNWRNWRYYLSDFLIRYSK